VWIDELPYVDEHAADIAADADDVWAALVETLDRSFSHAAASTYARAVGCDDHRASGPRPLAAGSAMPGFRVAVATAPSELVLVGRHRFSSYALCFHIDVIGAGHTQLRAETRAAFPGVTGAVYRTLVIGTRGHDVAVRRLLAGIKRRAESRARSAA
jgi:hypothetical protein